jgi:hypothetical protein
VCRAYAWSPAREARAFVVVLLLIKLAVSGWNAWAYNPRGSYDAGHHARRALEGGLAHRAKSYDGPLYYLPGLLWNDPATRDASPYGDAAAVAMKRLQYTNLVYLTAFYALWLFYLLPRVLPSWRNVTLASVALLSLPGYQRLAAAVHVDNLFALLATALFAVWVALDKKRVLSGVKVMLNALVLGLTGLTRPFAFVPMAIFGLLGARTAWRSSTRGRIWKLTLRVLVPAMLVVCPAGIWWGERLSRIDRPLGGLHEPSAGSAKQRLIKAVDVVNYYTTFYVTDLIDVPNRHYGKGFSGSKAKNPRANSFPTILYSELWGDHWLYFSQDQSLMEQTPGKRRTAASPGAGNTDHKRLAKSVALVVALPFTLVGILRFFSGAWAILRRTVTLRRVTAGLVSLTVAVLGFSVFVAWQYKGGLKPGNQTTIKFFYFAYCVAFFVVPIFFRRVRAGWRYGASLALLCLLYGAMLPVAVVWP